MKFIMYVYDVLWFSFYSCFIFYFPLLFCMVVYDNEFEIKEK